jgi:uncharacterized protein (TIGR02466 family)
MDATILPLFSKVIYANDLNIDATKILKELKENFKTSGYKYLTDGNSNVSLVGSNKSILEDKKFKNIKIVIEKEFKKYVEDVLRYENKFKITTSWITKSKPNQESNYHNHNNCMFSGVLYLKANENSGGIDFLNFENNRFLLKAKDYNVFNGRNYTLDAKEGRILFFPSEVYHKILKNRSSEDRYSLAFNFIPIGNIGNLENDSHLKNLNVK